MAQITSGLRSVLSFPSIYNKLQRALGGEKKRKQFCNEILRLSKHDTVLDIGCGTSELLAYFPKGISYFGFDISEEYIRYAQNRYRGLVDAHFYAEEFSDESLLKIPKVDFVYMGGLLHHLDDEEVEVLFRLASQSLKEGGRLITVDPCFVDDQGLLSKFFVSRDRGQNVRHPEVLAELARPYYGQVVATHHYNLLRIPYDHVVLECKV